MIEQKVRELIEHRNETLDQWKGWEDAGLEGAAIIYELDTRAKEFEFLLVELGALVGVQCRLSVGR